MSELVRIDDMVAASKQLLMTMYQGRAGVEGLIAAFAAHNQRIEDSFFALLAGRLLVTANTGGQTLDSIGDLVGVGRNGLPDEDFRLLIKAKVSENHADGTLPTLLRVVQQLFQSSAVWAGTPVSVTPSFVGGPFISLMIGSPAVPARLFSLATKLVRESRPGGINITTIGIFNAKQSFAFLGPQPWVGGWGSVNDTTVGAPFAGVLPL